MSPSIPSPPPATRQGTAPSRHPLLPSLLLVLLTWVAVAARADAANSTLNVKCTFTIASDVSIAWDGTTAASGAADLAWNIGTATLSTTYSTPSLSSGSGWIGSAAGQTVTIINNSATGNAATIALNLVCGNDLFPGGWTAGATPARSPFVAYCAANSAVSDQAGVIASGALAASTPTFLTIAATAQSPSLWFGITMPSAITTGGSGTGGSHQYTLAYTFTGSAN